MSNFNHLHTSPSTLHHPTLEQYFEHHGLNDPSATTPRTAKRHQPCRANTSADTLDTPGNTTTLEPSNPPPAIPAALESHIAMPNGGRAARCHATSKRTGLQCNAPARIGYAVCKSHGAGTRKRVQAGERYDPRDAGYAGAGSHITPRRASQNCTTQQLASQQRLAVYGSSIDHATQGLLALEDPDNTDVELAAVRAVMWKLIEQSQAEERARLDLERLMAELNRAQINSPGERKQLERLLRQVKGLHRRVSHYLERVQKSGVTVVKLIERRSTTRVRSLQVKLLEEFGRWVLLLRECLWVASSDGRVIDRFERELREQVLTRIPLLIDFPPLESQPDPLEMLMSGRNGLIVREVMQGIEDQLEASGEVIAVSRVDLDRWKRDLMAYFAE